MKYIKIFLLLDILAILTTCKPPSPEDINIIPQPVTAYAVPGSFTLQPETRIITQMENADVVAVCDFFNDVIERSAGFRLQMLDDEEVKNISGDIVITTYNADTSWHHEGYELRVSDGSSVVLQANNAAGLFYGVQTLLQLFPPEIMQAGMGEALDLEIPAVYVGDRPRLEWRGMHLDVCRHFFPKEFVMKYLDLMAMYKFNTFHWHLTDDQGWRIEINKYPKLAEISAWRTEADGSRYGGYYTQDDIREIVAYAAERHITVVPEIEMPGHSVAALAAYPELSCTGGPFEVATIWGVKEDVYCAGNDQVFEFLENVLLEVIELFPGEYIHVGGDEVPKIRWEHCSKCQARIRKEGLKDEDELQSYFIRRIEKFLNEHGRKLIGWDEILEGGLAPEAAVMSWRGEAGGIEAAQMGHKVVMTPTDYCYFDYYQENPATQAKAIGGLITLKDVYHYDPVSKELNEAQQENIMGVQGNLWTEYIATPEYAEYMAIPRMLALAEVAWTRSDKHKWERFIRKLDHQFYRLDILDVNYCDAIYAVGITPEYDAASASLKISMDCDVPDATIYYTLDGTDPAETSMKYDTSFSLDRSAVIKARLSVQGDLKKHITSHEFKLHKGIGKTISYKHKYSDRYTAGGDEGLLNGISGSIHHNDGNWQGFSGEDLDLTIDLGAVEDIKSISVGFMQSMTMWIWLPATVSFQVADSPEGPFKSAGEFINSIPMTDKEPMIKYFSRNWNDLSGRYVRIYAKNPGPCPGWHPGAGNPSWMFVDEIVIY